MLAYYGYTISPNQIETGEGFLICRNVPIARTGDMQYLESELGLAGTRVVTVHRDPAEVFSEAALASFEGKPVTDNHPPQLLDPDTVSMYEKGHAQGIRRGTGEWEGYVIADLHIHDRGLILAIQGGKREISCGYECGYTANGDGTYSQHSIRGNHVAVVDRGRAGKRAAILDSDKPETRKAPGPERKAMKKKGLIFSLFGQAVKDKSPEEIEQLAMDAAAALEEDAGSAAAPQVKEPEEKKETGEPAQQQVKDAAFFDVLNDKMDTILALLDGAAGKEGEEKKDPMDAAIEELEGGKKDGEEPGKEAGDGSAAADPSGDDRGGAKVVPAGDAGSNASGIDRVLAASILRKVRPAVAAIGDEKQRKAVADAIIAGVTDTAGTSDIARIMQATQRNAAHAADSRTQAGTEEIQKAYDSMNPHRKETK